MNGFMTTWAVIIASIWHALKRCARLNQRRPKPPWSQPLQEMHQLMMPSFSFASFSRMLSLVNSRIIP